MSEGMITLLSDAELDQVAAAGGDKGKGKDMKVTVTVTTPTTQTATNTGDIFDVFIPLNTGNFLVNGGIHF